MSVPARISFVTLGVQDLKTSTGFYEALGWPRSSTSTEEVAFFQTAQAVLSLYPVPLLAAEIGVEPLDPPRFRAVTLAINVEDEADVLTILDEAVAAGGTIPRPGCRTVWGGFTGIFADPDGHLWEVAHNPFFPLMSDGTVLVP